MSVEFRILGPLEIVRDGAVVEIGGKKQRAALAMLLLNANEVVSTDRLIDALWGEAPPESAPKALQVHISQLRKAIEPERGAGDPGRLVVTRTPGYMLALDPEKLDLARFDLLARDGHDALAAGDPERAAKCLHEALSLWRGAPLADLSYEPFAQTEVARLEELRVGVLEDRIEADLERGRHAEVIAELERLVSREPLRERPRRQLMLALYRAGRQAKALDAYSDARRALVEALGIEPGRELKELHAAILAQDPALERRPPPRRPGPAASAPTAGAHPPPQASSESFVGRERELTELRVALEDAIAGRTSILLIAGEPGIGKSRLADEATSLAEERDADVLWGRCWEAGGAPAYWPWVQALRAYIRDGEEDRIRRQLEPYAADIAQMLPELHQLFDDLPPAPSRDPEGARFRLFDSVASFLRAAAATRPLVLVLDDLHAADKPSLLLLQFLARSLREARLLVIGAYRDTEPRTEDLTAGVAEVRREPVTRSIRLGGLDVSEVARVIELTAGTPASDELASAVHRETEGNPLFVGELVRLLASEGRLEEAAGPGGALSIPVGVREVIDHRLRRLSDDCRTLLSVASVLGRDFQLDLLSGVSGRTMDEIHDLLDEAQTTRVVLDAPTGRGALRFSHALIRDSLYGDLGTKERLLLHQRAVEGLEDLYGEHPEPHLAELAYHSLAAAAGGDVGGAVEYARRAGDQAAALLAFEEAARLYEMALEALEMRPSPDEAGRAELLLALGDVQARGGDMPTAKETFVRAADVARTLAAPDMLARAALGYGGRWIWFRAGKDHRLIELLEDALDALPEGDSQLRAMLLARLAGALRDHPVPERRAALTGEALEIARRLGDPRTLAHAVGGAYSAFSWPRDIDAWLQMGRELVRLGTEMADKEQAFFGHFHALGALMVRGDIDGARREFEATARAAQELKQPNQVWVAWVAEAMLDLFAGRLDRAETLLQSAVELGSAAEGSEATYMYVVTLQTWALRREQGRLAEVEAPLERYVAEYPDVFIHRCALASLHAELGHHEQARREFDRLAADDFADLHVGTEWFFGASLLAGVCDQLADAAGAAPLYAALHPYADYNVYAHPEATLGSASRPLGLLAGTMRRWEDAEHHFEQALEMNTRMGTPLWTAHTRHEFGRMLLARRAPGDDERAAELLETARDEYAELGMAAWEALVTPRAARR